MGQASEQFLKTNQDPARILQELKCVEYWYLTHSTLESVCYLYNLIHTSSTTLFPVSQNVCLTLIPVEHFNLFWLYLKIQNRNTPVRLPDIFF